MRPPDRRSTLCCLKVDAVTPLDHPVHETVTVFLMAAGMIALVVFCILHSIKLLDATFFLVLKTAIQKEIDVAFANTSPEYRSNAACEQREVTV
jgi:hypothetical protein